MNKSAMISFADNDGDKLVVDQSANDGDLYFQTIPSKPRDGGIVRLEPPQIDALIKYLVDFQNDHGEKWPGYIDSTEAL